MSGNNVKISILIVEKTGDHANENASLGIALLDEFGDVGQKHLMPVGTDDTVKICGRRRLDLPQGSVDASALGIDDGKPDEIREKDSSLGERNVLACGVKGLSAKQKPT